MVKYTLYIFVGLFLPLYLVFTGLAGSMKSFKVYWTGVAVSALYFIAATEGLVLGFNKIPMIGFLVNPFQGQYKFLALNFKYNMIFFILVLILVIAGIFYVKGKSKQEQPQAEANIPNSPV